MKSIEQIIIDLNACLDSYKIGLETYSADTLSFKKDKETWSLSEMYEHVLMSAQKFFLANTKRCIEKRSGQEGGEKNEHGVQITALGSFPPIKIKMPAAVTIEMVTRPVENYLEDIEIIRSSAINMAELVRHDEGTYKIMHPVFGFLNASEWFLQLQMHSTHHLMQKAELESFALNA